MCLGLGSPSSSMSLCCTGEGSNSRPRALRGASQCSAPRKGRTTPKVAKNDPAHNPPKMSGESVTEQAHVRPIGKSGPEPQRRQPKTHLRKCPRPLNRGGIPSACLSKGSCPWGTRDASDPCHERAPGMAILATTAMCACGMQWHKLNPLRCPGRYATPRNPKGTYRR